MWRHPDQSGMPLGWRLPTAHAFHLSYALTIINIDATIDPHRILSLLYCYLLSDSIHQHVIRLPASLAVGDVLARIAHVWDVGLSPPRQLARSTRAETMASGVVERRDAQLRVTVRRCQECFLASKIEGWASYARPQGASRSAKGRAQWSRAQLACRWCCDCGECSRT
jgi:hypothetical protein